MTDGIVLGVSGWFTAQGTRYHEDRRLVSEIAAEDWSGLLAHAEAIRFFTRPEPATAGPDDRIFHLRITAADRTRELAINDPFDTPEFARLISLTRRCLRDRRVFTSETMTEEDVARFMASMSTDEELRPDRRADE